MGARSPAEDRLIIGDKARPRRNPPVNVYLKLCCSLLLWPVSGVSPMPVAKATTAIAIVSAPQPHRAPRP